VDTGHDPFLGEARVGAQYVHHLEPEVAPGAEQIDEVLPRRRPADESPPRADVGEDAVVVEVRAYASGS
jgi:hypothetical protein